MVQPATIHNGFLSPQIMVTEEIYSGALMLLLFTKDLSFIEFIIRNNTEKVS